MDFGGGSMENTVCGASTRKKTLCQKKPLFNGRCGLHGGKSTGPKNKEKHRDSLKGNKNALKTGEYETILYDTLTDEEKELYELVSTDPAKQVNGRYKMVEIRAFRLMQRHSAELKKEKPDFSVVDSIEQALVRNDSRAIELIRENRALLDGPSNTDNGSLDQLVLVLQGARSERQKGE